MKEDINPVVEYFNGDEMAATVWAKKYALRDEKGEAMEHMPSDMHHRMAKYFADIEAKYDTAQDVAADKTRLSEYGQRRERLTEDKIFRLFDHFKYVVPGGSVMSGLGSAMPVSLSNCWVIDSLTDSIDGIFKTCNEMSQLFKRRGGVGFDISKLRPSGAVVNNAAKYSTGAVSFMDLFSTVTTTIAQSGRRGAVMLSIHIDHPDAKEFIEKKQDLTKVTGANISVQIGDDFMNAVINDTDFYQTWPIDKKVNIDESAEYDTLVETTDEDGNKAYFKKIRAKELWNTLVHCAWNTAEPGILFKTKHYNYSPDGIYDRFRGTSTNPCLVGDTMIQTDKGPIAIKDIVERMKEGETFRVLTFNEETMEGEYNNVTASMKTRENADVIEIETEDGEKLRLTPDHRVYTENRGWVEASKLTNHDILCKSDFETATTVKSIKNASSEDVYDLTVENNHNFFANGLLVHNCGEIFMREDSCRLIHVNFSSFIKDEYTEKATIDADKLYRAVYETVHLGDDLVDLEAEAIGKILRKIESDGNKDGNEYCLYARLLENTLQGRRCGVGFFGLADALAKLGVKFDSDEGLKVIGDLMDIFYKAQLDSEIDMSITRGSFPAYSNATERAADSEWYTYLKANYPEQYERMMAFGRRNVSFGTCAPTGSVAMLARCSSGIEPIFMPFYTRRVKCTTEADRVDFIDRDGEKFTEYITPHPTLKEWGEKQIGDTTSWGPKQWQECYEKSPWYGSTANDIDWSKRVEIQSIVQKRISHSISSTINLPNNTTEEEVSTIYLESWKRGLKGVTVYRDGCRSGVIVAVEKKEEPKKDAPMICMEDGTAKRRPKTLEAKIIRFNNKGDKWVGIIGMLDGKPYELFTGMLEKLNIPAWVEGGSIVKNYEEINVDGEIKKKSRYDFCYEDKDGYRVCIEGISRIFNPEFWNYGKLISGLLRHHMPIPYIVKVISTLKLDDSSINTWKNGVVRVLRKFENSVTDEIDGEKCPECGGRLVRDGGCIHCIDCGYSKCG